jgi:glycosyltransferase involved in cell wall biosynthesis
MAPRVLTLAYHFPPIGGAGVQRNAQLTRQLAAFGWSQTVISGPGRGGSRWTPLDPAVGSGRDAFVLRLPSSEPRVGPWGERAERWLRLRSAWAKWWKREVLRIASEVNGEVDVIHASLAPYQTAETAVALARSIRVPLVLDLEDPWAFDDMLVYPTAVHRSLERARMRRILRHADVIVMNTEEAARRVRAAFPELRATDVLAIPNGFDARDFAAPVPPLSDDVFRIVHTGSFHTDLGLRALRASRIRRALGGFERDANFLARSPTFLLEALERVFLARPELSTRVELHLVGTLTDEDERLLQGKPYVRRHGFLSHEQTIAMIRNADLLFLPLYDLPEGLRAAIVPQKTYEYIASGRPILAAVPDGDARDLLEACETARLCRPTDVDSLAATILRVAELERGCASDRPMPHVVRSCESTQMAATLAAVFARAAERSHSRVGTAASTFVTTAS